MTISDRTILDYDASGFILGIDRMNKGIDNVSDNTDEIIQILKAQRQVSDTRMIELARAVRAIEHHISTQNSINNNRKRSSESAGTRRVLPPSSDTSSNNRISSNAPIHRQRAADGSSGSNTEAGNRVTNNRSRITSDVDSEQSSSSRTATNQGSRDSAANRERDANGRFTGGSSTIEGSSGSSGSFGRGIGSTNTSGVDPLIDSFNEAKDLLSPLTRGAGMIGRGAKLSISKLRSLKRREPLPSDQSRHNNENEKLLDKIWKAVLRSDRGGGNGGGGLLGSLLGGGGRNRRRGGRGGVGGGLKKLLKKVGGFKGLSVLAGLAGSAALAMDWDNLDHKGKSAGVGGLAGMGVGGLIGGTLGAVGGPLGMAAGAAIGGWLGSEGGEWLGSVASPHIDSWTQSMIRYNLPDKMSGFWEEGIKPFFATMISAASNFYETSLSQVSAAIDNVGNFIEGGTDGVTSSNAGANGASPANLSEKQKSNQMMVYKAFRNAGMSDGQSRAMTAEIGRENGYQDKYLFGNHIDPANGKRNVGMMSWQKDRGENVYNRLKSSGQIKNGQMLRTQENLNEQARFAVHEINTIPAYRRTKEQFLDNPNVSYNKANEVLANNYILWRANDPKYAKHHIYRDQYKASIDKQLKPIEDTSIIDEAKDKAHKAGATVREAVKSGAANAKGYTGGVMGPETNQMIRDNIQPSMPASNDALIFKSSLGVAAGQASGGYTPPSLPTKPMLDIPKMPRISQRLDSGSDNKPMVIQSSNATISQNVSDRGLAHAITGGIGKDRYYG